MEAAQYEHHLNVLNGMRDYLAQLESRAIALSKEIADVQAAISLNTQRIRAAKVSIAGYKALNSLSEAGQ